jgi:hypothetical protein
MPVKSVLMAIALAGWLVAGVIAFMVVAYTSFFGVAAVGLVLWFICTRFELEEDGVVGNISTTSLLASQLRAKNELPREQRAAQRHAHSLAMQTAHFFRNLGLALTLIGVAGFLWYQI